MKLIDNFLTVDGKISSSKIKNCDKLLLEEIYDITDKLDPGAGIVERLYWIKHSLNAYPKKCLTCGSDVKSFYSFSRGYVADYCSTACARKSKIADRKKKETIKKRYGVDSIWKIKDVVEKRNNTCRSRFGNTDPLHLAREKFLSQKNVNHVSEIPEIKEKRLKTIREREISKLVAHNPDFIIDKTSYQGADLRVKITCRRCGLSSDAFPDKIFCAACDKLGGRSSLEHELLMELQPFIKDEEVVVNKKLKGLNIYPDLFFPRKNLAIEIDGNYWHAEGRGGDKLKSYNKRKIYSENGINSLFFFEDEVIFKREIVKSIILSKLNIFKRELRASKCSVKSVPKAECQQFLDENHLQGWCRSSFEVGLYYQDELLAIATFGHARFHKSSNVIELLRLCFKNGVKIHGGASKLVKFAKGALNNASILSYSNNRYSNGQVYRALNFEKISENYPNYFYVSKNNYLKRMSRLRFQKHKLIQLGGKPELTEWENAQLLNLDRIFDCGTGTWILK